MSVEPNIDNLLIALENSLFLGCFDVEYSAIDYMHIEILLTKK